MLGDDYGYEGDDAVELPMTELVHQTEAAILVRFENGEKMWVPKRWVSEETELYEKGDVGSLYVARWWALENDIET